MTSIRLPISFCLSALTTAALFWFLAMVIVSHPPGEWIHTREVQIASRFIPEPPEPVQPLPVKPPKPKPLPPGEAFELIVATKHVAPGEDESNLLPQGVDWRDDGTASPRDEARLPQSSGSNRGPVPQLRIEPDYPPQARDRGIEGWVRFSYTVASDGSVKDVVILDSQPARIWDSATIRAVSNWKYQPAIVDGRPVEQAGLVASYRFELD